MKSEMYPFSHKKRDYPNGSLIIKEILQSRPAAQIEYDVEQIKKALNNEIPVLDFKDFPKITDKQLMDLLSVVTNSIVEVSFEDKQ